MKKLLSVSLILIMFLCSGCDSTKNNITQTPDPMPLKPECTFTLQGPEDGAVQHTQLQHEYRKDKYTRIQNYADGSQEISAPQALHFAWAASPVNFTTAPTGYRLIISENADLSSPYIDYSTKNTEADMYNFKAGVKYYWAVAATFGEMEIISEVMSFTTDATLPRNIYVEGVSNVRDIGGWETKDGKKVKQGMIYRSGQFNKKDGPAPIVTIAGSDMMVKQLGIKTEVDLRYEGVEDGKITSSPLGKRVKYIQTSMYWTGDIIKNETQGIRDAIRLMADESNYPMVVHCMAGTDRTGLIAFLVLGLLGVDRSDILTDYLFSNFANLGAPRSTASIDHYTNVCKGHGGRT